MFHKLTDDRRGVEGLGAIWIGDSVAEAKIHINAILNVAHDLKPTRGWSAVEYMHVGLIDGPGNEVTAYCAAVLALHAMLKKHNVLICCHSGGRALAVALMYLCATTERSWENWLIAIQERIDTGLPEVNPVHRDKFSKVAEVLDNTIWS